MEINSLIQNFNDMMSDFKDKFLEFIPNIILSILLLALGYLIGRLLKFIVIKFIRYIHKFLEERFSGSIHYINLEQSANFLGNTFFWLVLISTFVLISDTLGLQIITTWMESILIYSPNLLAAVFIVLFAIVIGKISAEVIASVGIKLGLTYSTTLGTIVKYLIFTAAIIIAIDQIGIEVAILINIINIVLAALLFGAAFAFGLGARTAISNILGSFYVRKIFKVGDQIKIDEIQGRIAKIDVTSVIIDTSSGQVMVPTKTFSESKSFLITKDHLQ